VAQADDIADPLPGWMVGGPDARKDDKADCAGRKKYPSDLPALSYLDNACSYTTNEVAISWNAPLVYVIAALRTLTPAH
jgi:endoglucanase